MKRRSRQTGSGPEAGSFKLTGLKSAGRYGLVVFLVLIVSYHIYSISFYPPIYVDEYSLASFDHSYGSFRLVGNTSIPFFTAPSISMMPLYLYPLKGSIRLFGHGPFGMRALQSVCTFFSGLLLVLIILLFSNLDGVQEGLLFCFFLTFPTVWRSGHVSRPEAIVIVLLLLTLYLNLSYRGKNQLKHYLIGLLSTAPAFVKIAGVLTVPVFFLANLSMFFGLKDSGEQRAFVRGLLSRGAGAVSGFVVYISIVDDPIAIFRRLTSPEVARLNRVHLNLFGRLHSLFMPWLADWYLYVPMGLVIAYALWRSRKSLKPGGPMVLFLSLALTFGLFVLMTRPTLNYTVYVDVFLLLIFALSVARLRKNIQVGGVLAVLMALNMAIIVNNSLVLKGFSFKKSEKIFRSIIADEQAHILARIQYKGYFFEDRNFLALEDYALRILVSGRVEIESYFERNNVEYVFIDQTVRDSEEYEALLDYVLKHLTLLASIPDYYNANRRYDLVTTFLKKRDRPDTISVYRVSKTEERDF